MRVEAIEIGHAEDGFRAQLHESVSTQNLVDGIYLDDTPFSDSDSDSETLAYGPGIKDWLVLSCISLVAMMDAFHATMMTPIVPVCLASQSLDFL
jgi:hypothetical protein